MYVWYTQTYRLLQGKDLALPPSWSHPPPKVENHCPTNIFTESSDMYIAKLETADSHNLGIFLEDLSSNLKSARGNILSVSVKWVQKTTRPQTLNWKLSNFPALIDYLEMSSNKLTSRYHRGCSCSSERVLLFVCYTWCCFSVCRLQPQGATCVCIISLKLPGRATLFVLFQSLLANFSVGRLNFRVSSRHLPCKQENWFLIFPKCTNLQVYRELIKFSPSQQSWHPRTRKSSRIIYLLTPTSFLRRRNPFTRKQQPLVNTQT